MVSYIRYARVLDLHTIVAFFQSFVNAYCEWEKRDSKSTWWQQISKSFTYFVFHYTSCPPSFVNFWRLYIDTVMWILDIRHVTNYTVTKNNRFYQSMDGNCVDFGVCRYQSPKTWNLNDKVWTELAHRSTLTFLSYPANFWNLGTEYRKSCSK